MGSSPSAVEDGGWAVRAPVKTRTLTRVEEVAGSGEGLGRWCHTRHRFVPFTVAFWQVPVV